MGVLGVIWGYWGTAVLRNVKRYSEKSGIIDLLIAELGSGLKKIYEYMEENYNIIDYYRETLKKLNH